MQNSQLTLQKTAQCGVAPGIAKLMALPTAPRLPPKASPNQRAAYNGYWLAVTAQYQNVLSLQQWKGDNQWLPEYKP
ncbi:hypothetical protein [Mucilaginibacter pedocola]|uniref:Uncharacterized protein n=1 Tax=Mucilaginibacter pedocola TaxID=1792845 RepID=A0A1S9P878_9SPHI|nr:hypothetical protein [Mucilaginibacter pedocola]OOQ57163.1 hypothetical protein BC343_16720 [Mucilaginibacter pedocola]